MPKRSSLTPPPIGPVTIIRHGKTHHGNWRRGTVRHNVSHNLIQANVQRSDEGITWIRGHHDRRSAAVKALWAAYALSQCGSSVVPREEFERVVYDKALSPDERAALSQVLIDRYGLAAAK